MFNVINKSLIIVSVATLLAACSGKKEMTPEMSMYQNAESAFNANDYDLAIQLLDSLDRSHPKDTEAMRLSMALRPRAIEQQALRQIAKEDSLIEANRVEIDRLKSLLTFVTLPGAGGYWTDSKQYKSDFLNGTGISGRVTDIGEFYIVSSLNPAGGLKHNSIAVNFGDVEVATPEVPYDGVINYRISGSEMISFSPAQSDSIGMAFATHPGVAGTLRFLGENGKSKSVKLSAAQTDAIANTYNYAKAVNGMRDATIRREKLNAMLDLARTKIAEQQSQTK